jgi:DNA (cytosine-5)-methyltransferase 1
MTQEKFLTLQEVADRLRVSERSVFRYIHSGRLEATKVGYWRIKESDLEKFLKENSSVKKKRKTK